MNGSLPRILTAGEREAGGTCAHCRMAIQYGQGVAVCNRCGELHHESCWQLKQHCGSYECAQAIRSTDSAQAASLVISRDDLNTVVPMPSRSSTASSSQDASAASGAKRWNKGSIWAFVISLIGIPLFGIVTGLVAILVACIALVGHRHNQRGLALGVLAIVIGMADVVGWAVGMSYYVGSSQTMISLQDMAIDLESLDDLPDHLARAMRANVVVHSAVSLGRESMGSGVVLSIHDKLAYIVTNRHVVDPEYTGENSPPPDDLSTFDRIFISTLEHATLPAKVEWIAPGGVDLAILSTSVHGDGVRAARWSLDTTPHIGDKVFAIGNPHGLGWTHSSGDISQIRARSQGGYRVRILQTTAAINPGNSGGGLYDEKGQLIGVNTLTGDKRVAEGLGFSIALPTLLDLAPKRLATLTKDTEASSE